MAVRYRQILPEAQHTVGMPLDKYYMQTLHFAAEQMDVHEATATVREAMRFSAHLRQPYSVPTSEKDDYVEELIELLELEELADVLVKSLGIEGDDIFAHKGNISQKRH